MKTFFNRSDAGQVLAKELRDYRGRDVIILALPRGGVPVAFEIAQFLSAPLDILLVRKLGFPGFEEYALGAIASGGVRVLNPEAAKMGRCSEGEIEAIAAREQQELERRERAYRGDRPFPDLHRKTVILVDDGLATGSTMRAAVAAVRLQNPARIVVAVPVASAQACESLASEADEVVCVFVPERFRAVGEWYTDFAQTTDEEVKELIHRNNPLRSAA